MPHNILIIYGKDPNFKSIEIHKTDLCIIDGNGSTETDEWIYRKHEPLLLKDHINNNMLSNATNYQHK